MNIRYTCAGIGVAVLWCAPVAAQTTQPESTTTGAQQSITLVGCLQTEADYRRAQDAGRGGVAMTGAGLGNEYVLIQTEGAGGPGGYEPAGNADCGSSTAFAGTAYELTGTRERELAQFVGRRVEITGELKNADESGRPGGFDPAIVSTDLRLHEVNVASFREVAMTAQAQRAEVQPRQTQAPGSAQRETSGTSGQAQQPGAVASAQTELPRTASPMALYGILGLISLAGAAALRRSRR